MNLTRLHRAALAGVALGLGLAVAAPVAAQDVELLVWDQFTDENANRAADAVYAAFMEKHPEIAIKREVYAYDQIRSIARTSLGSGTGPDVIYHEVGEGNAGVLARAELIRPLDDYAEQYGWNERISPAALAEGRLGDKLYGLGLEFEFFGVFYNTSEIEALGLQAPTNLDELKAFCAAAREQDRIPFALNLNPGYQAYHLVSAAIYDVLGAEATEALLFQNEGRWDSPEVIEALRIVLGEMRDAECYPEDVNAMLYEDAAALFYTGEALAWPTGTWALGRVASNMTDGDVTLTAFPSIAGDDSTALPTGVGSAYYIAQNSEHPDEAAVFLDYLFSEEAAKIWVEEAGFIPPISFDTAQMEVSDLFLSALRTVNDAGSEEGDAVRLATYINHFVPEAFVNALRSGSQGIVAGVMTPEDLAKEFQAHWDAAR